MPRIALITFTLLEPKLVITTVNSVCSSAAAAPAPAAGAATATAAAARKVSPFANLYYMVPTTGLEPTTSSLPRKCSTA